MQQKTQKGHLPTRTGYRSPEYFPLPDKMSTFLAGTSQLQLSWQNYFLDRQVQSLILASFWPFVPSHQFFLVWGNSLPPSTLRRLPPYRAGNLCGNTFTESGVHSSYLIHQSHRRHYLRQSRYRFVHDEMRSRSRRPPLMKQLIMHRCVVTVVLSSPDRLIFLRDRELPSHGRSTHALYNTNVQLTPLLLSRKLITKLPVPS